MKFISDLHLHSKYSRAVSQNMVLPVMSQWAKKKGLDIITTGDWTHPLWFRHIKEELSEINPGLFSLKKEKAGPLFLLTTEISSIYSQGGKTRRIHNLIVSPSIETCEKINNELSKRGCNLMSDGRPIIGLSSKNLLELVLEIDKTALLIPCHAWTPWFSLYGSMSGFDSIDECFEEYSKYIFAIETGLSSDPEMNWRIKELEKRTILSFSDSHSPAKMGREATVFELEKPTFKNIRRAIIGPNIKEEPEKLPDKVLYTIEFYPEEGKYHFTGHRNCAVVQSPGETEKNGVICPSCSRLLTVGVMHRVEDLASVESTTENRLDKRSVKWVEDPTGKHPPFVKMVPLLEIIAESFDSTVVSQKTRDAFELLCKHFNGEINVLMETDLKEIEKVAGSKIREGIEKVRKGEIVINPGFDGQYGVVRIWNTEVEKKKKKTVENQLGLDF